MALTKKDIIQRVHQETDLSKARSAQILEKTIEIMKDALADGNDVLISGFGKFCVKDKSERRGRNPATGDPLTLSARRVVTFKCSGKLRQLCNDGQCEDES